MKIISLLAWLLVLCIGGVARADRIEVKNRTAIITSATHICAGGVNSPPHQAEIKLIVRNSNGSGIVGKTVSFSVDTFLPDSLSSLSSGDPDADLRSTIFPTTAVTNAEGVARATVTSSKQIGARAIVKALVDEDEYRTESIFMGDATGDMTIDTDTLEADGQSQASIYLTLDHNNDAVSEHQINFYIAAVADANGDPVQPAADGSFPAGYGSINTVQGETDDLGIAYGTYTAGTLSGTITFGSADNSVFVNTDVIAKSVSKANFLRASYSKFDRMVQSAPRVRRPRRRTKRGAGSARPVARVSMNFVRVCDVNGHTSIPVFNPQTAIAAANKVWFPKAQIQFYMKNSVMFACRLPGDEANIVDDLNLDFNHLQMQHDIKNPPINRPVASLTLYFCKGIRDSLGRKVLGIGRLGGPFLMLQDGNATKVAAAFSHELGHSLNEKHIVDFLPNGQENPKYLYLRVNLMYPINNEGEQLTTEQCDRANAFARANFR